MTNNNPVVFDPKNQWAKELGASFIGSMAVIYFRELVFSTTRLREARRGHSEL